VLRRIANHLFWAARYLERAEWRARLVDVNYHLLVESPRSTQEGWEPLLAITGDRQTFARHRALMDEAGVLNFFAFDRANPSSIASCIAMARENCRALRPRISSEFWLEVNTLYLDAQQWTMPGLYEAGVYQFFAELRERFYRIAGVVQSTMPRDLGHDFLTVGQMLEAAENVTRLLDVKYHFLLPRPQDVGSPLDLSQWAALLRSASALEAYRSLHGNFIRIPQVVDFLLFDPAFPRAARFCVERLDQALARIAPPGEGNIRVPTVRALAQRLATGAARDVIELGLHEYLLEIQADCARISDQVFADYLQFE
jgi:uncharacterized alpha-E superfamily protein